MHVVASICHQLCLYDLTCGDRADVGLDEKNTVNKTYDYEKTRSGSAITKFTFAYHHLFFICALRTTIICHLPSMRSFSWRVFVRVMASICRWTRHCAAKLHRAINVAQSRSRARKHEQKTRLEGPLAYLPPKAVFKRHFKYMWQSASRQIFSNAFINVLTSDDFFMRRSAIFFPRHGAITSGGSSPRN
jgi:hypothetical protein